MIVPTHFYRGFPPDGTVSVGNGPSWVTVHDLGAQVPGGKRWLVDSIMITNLTQVTGYFSAGIFPSSFTNSIIQPDMAAMNTDPLPRSISTAAYGIYLAYSQPIDPHTTLVMPCAGWALGTEKLWAGVYPGQLGLVGFGGVCMTISGREYR